jgi:hypothetical protein
LTAYELFQSGWRNSKMLFGSNIGLPHVCRSLQVLGSRHMQQCVFAFQYVVLHGTIATLVIAA